MKKNCLYRWYQSLTNLFPPTAIISLLFPLTGSLKNDDSDAEDDALSN